MGIRYIAFMTKFVYIAMYLTALYWSLDIVMLTGH